MTPLPPGAENGAQTRVAIITGAARGIGRVYAEGFAREGWAVALVDREDCDAAASAAAAAGAAGVAAIEADVSEEPSVTRMARATLEAFGRIDALVNNAGLFWGLSHGPMEDLTVEEWDRCFAVNVRGTWLASRAVVPAMRERGRGRIVNTSSMSVADGAPGFLHYVSSKSAVVGMTRALARELGGDGIAVNTVSPDLIVHRDLATPALREQAERLRMTRALPSDARSEDLLGTVLFLAGDGAGFVTGQNVYVNGGRLFN